jgi:hypothetical protein
MIITTAMGPGAGLGGQGGGAPRREVIGRDSKCIRGRPGATSSTVGPPPRRTRRTGTRAPLPVRNEGPVCPGRPGTRSRGPVAHPVRPPPSPVRPSRGPGARDGIPGTSVPAARSPVYPSSDKFVRGYRQVDQVHPPGPHRGAGRPGRSSSTYRRTGTPAETSAAPPPRGTRMSRTPGDRSPSTAGGTRPGCTGSTAGANVRPVHRGAPRLEPLDMFGVQHRRRPPRGTGARRCCWGSQGRVPRRGTPRAGLPGTAGYGGAIA